MWCFGGTSLNKVAVWSIILANQGYQQESCGCVRHHGSKYKDFPSCFRRSDYMNGYRPCDERSTNEDRVARIPVRIWRKSTREVAESVPGSCPGKTPLCASSSPYHQVHDHF